MTFKGRSRMQESLPDLPAIPEEPSLVWTRQADAFNVPMEKLTPKTRQFWGVERGPYHGEASSSSA